MRIIVLRLARLARLRYLRLDGTWSFLQSGTLRGSEKFLASWGSFLMKWNIQPRTGPLSGHKKTTEGNSVVHQEQVLIHLLRHHGWGCPCWGCWGRYRHVDRGCGGRRGAAAGGGCWSCTGIATVQAGELGLQLVEQAHFAGISTTGRETGEDRATNERRTAGFCFANWCTDRGCGGTSWCTFRCTGRVAKVWLQTRQAGLDLRQEAKAWAAGIGAAWHGLARCEARRRNAGRATASAVRAAHHDRGISAQGH